MQNDKSNDNFRLAGAAENDKSFKFFYKNWLKNHIFKQQKLL
jgi:hypothetical protein